MIYKLFSSWWPTFSPHNDKNFRFYYPLYIWSPHQREYLEHTHTHTLHTNTTHFVYSLQFKFIGHVSLEWLFSVHYQFVCVYIVIQNAVYLNFCVIWISVFRVWSEAFTAGLFNSLNVICASARVKNILSLLINNYILYGGLHTLTAPFMKKNK